MNAYRHTIKSAISIFISYKAERNGACDLLGNNVLCIGK